jgi:hypothetical protein
MQTVGRFWHGHCSKQWGQPRRRQAPPPWSPMPSQATSPPCGCSCSPRPEPMLRELLANSIRLIPCPWPPPPPCRWSASGRLAAADSRHAPLSLGQLPERPRETAGTAAAANLLGDCAHGCSGAGGERARGAAAQGSADTHVVLGEHPEEVGRRLHAHTKTSDPAALLLLCP